MTDVLIWVATGVFVGWITRLAMRSKRDYGLLGDLVTGSLGAAIGGWLLRGLGISIGVDGTAGLVEHVTVAIVGAMVLLGALRVVRQAAAAARIPPVTVRVPAIADLEQQVAKLGEFERRILSSVLKRGSVAVDPNRSFDAQLTLGERVADRVATFGGSWTFIGIFLTGMVLWMAMNQGLRQPFDPYPFILLNLVLSCLAALQAPIIMMSQNRQAAKDRSDARLDYEVNVRAEVQIAALHEKLDATRNQELARLSQMIEQQREMLAELSRLMSARSGGDA
jgi:uncharacterized membrane protein/uncharacterized membrane protein YeaQ/YmgE (transglycosylase-associated protein family)